MMKNITMGQYYPVDSWVHRLDPRTKILLTIAMIVAVFLVKSMVGYALILGFMYLVSKLSNIPFKMLVKGVKPLRFILILTFLLTRLAQVHNGFTLLLRTEQGSLGSAARNQVELQVLEDTLQVLTGDVLDAHTLDVVGGELLGAYVLCARVERDVFVNGIGIVALGEKLTLYTVKTNLVHLIKDDKYLVVLLGSEAASLCAELKKAAVVYADGEIIKSEAAKHACRGGDERYFRGGSCVT